MKYKVTKGASPHDLNKPVKEWATIEFVEYYKVVHVKALRIKSHKPEGILRAHLSEAKRKLLWGYGKADFANSSPSELYKDYIDWVFENKKTKKDGLIRIWFMSNEDMMTDFLDRKALVSQEKELGSMEDFRKQERERIDKARIEFENRIKEKEAEKNDRR